MSYNPDAIIYETQVVISNNSQPAGSTTGSFVNEGTLSTKDTFITGQTVVNNVNITPNTNYIIYERQSTLLNNRNNYTDIEDFTFNSSHVTSFKAIINVTVSTGEASHAVWEMNGLYKPNGWVITSSFTGDITGVFFSMRDDAGIGKIQYTNSNTSGTSIIRYRATTTAPPGTTPEGVSDGVGVSLVTSGNFIPNSLIYANGTNSFASTDITYNSNVFTIGGVSRVLAERATSFVSFSNGGAITSMGDASIAKKLIVGEKIGIATTAPGYTLDINGDLNFNGSLYQNGAAYKSSQWLSTGDNISYTTGSVHTIGLTTGNLNFTGDIYRNGVLYSGSAWITGTDGSLSYTSGSLIANNFSAQNAVFTNSSLGSATINDFVNLKTDNLNLGIANMYSGSFTANNNISTPANITGLAFDSGIVRSFNATVTITVLKSNNQNLYESYTLDGFQNGSGWVLYPSRIGDDSGVSFTINNTGQVKYTSIDHTIDWISTTIRFNVSTMNNQEGYSQVDFNTSGTYNVAGITAGNINFTGALYQNGLPFLGSSQWTNTIGGGISFTSGNVIIRDLNNTNISSTSLNVTGITAGSINFTSDIYKNGVLYSSSKWTATSGNISFTSGTVNATGFVASTITTGSLRATTAISAGTLTSTNAAITNITVSTLRITNSTISNTLITNANVTRLTAGTITSTDISTGTLQAPSGITVGNINFTGSLYQNGVAYLGSQWTTTSGNVSYTSGSVIATDLNVTTATAGAAKITNLNVVSVTSGNIIPSADLTYNLGSETARWKDLYLSNSTIKFADGTNLSTSSGNLQVTDTSTGKILSLGGGAISSANLSSIDILATNISANTLYCSTITGGTLSLSGDLVVGGTLTTVNITTTNLTDVNISTGTLNASSSTISNVLFTNISSSSLIVSNIINTNANITTLTAATLLNTDAVSTNVTAATLNLSTGITSASAQITNANITTLTAATLLNTNLVSGNITSSSFSLTSTNGNYTFGITDGNIYFKNPLSGYLWYENSTAANMRLTNGNLTVTGDITGFGNLSDIRLKKNVIDIAQMESLRVVNALRPVTFDWKDDIFNESKRNKNDAGFIAQEVEEIIPCAVSDYVTSDVNYKHIKHERILPYLVGSIQKLTRENDELRNRLTQIESLLQK